MRFSPKSNKAGPLDLLIIQGSPFCNINCKYCYLPDRANTKRISLETIKTLFRRIQEAGLISKEFTVVWHAGEPLTIPSSYYLDIFRTITESLLGHIKVSHSFQTNGMLINEEWCNIINEHNIRIGLSIDGPAFIHDKNRVKRNGNGTHSEAMRGVELLKKANIDFHVIAVVTDFSLDYPDEIFNFFLDMEVQRIGFNIEEVEGINNISTINEDSMNRIWNFFKRIFDLQKEHKGKIIVREFESAFRKIIGNPGSPDNLIDKTIPHSHMLNAYGIISVDYDGNFMTFSPELLGQKSEKYDNFILGNISSDSFINALGSEKYKKIETDIQTGIALCKESCQYFKVCGGGAPSNKYYENGTFRSTETLFCKYSIQMPVDIVLKDIEESLAGIPYK